MKLAKLALTAAATLTLLTGCVTYTPKYYENFSLAHNAASEGGVYGVKDRSVPKEDIGNFTQSVEFGAIYTAAGLSGTALGLSSLGGGLFHLVDALTDSGPDANRVTMFAWMPESYADNAVEAKQKMFNLMDTAIRKTLEDRGLAYSPVSSNDNEDLLAYYVHDEEIGCPTLGDIQPSRHHTAIPFYLVRTEACVVRASIKKVAGINNTPSDIRMSGHVEPKSYTFYGSNTHKQMNAIHVQRGLNSTLPENALYLEISKNLPEWVFMHLGPGRVSVSPEHTIPFPYLLNKGEPHFYVRPK